VILSQAARGKKGRRAASLPVHGAKPVEGDFFGGLLPDLFEDGGNAVMEDLLFFRGDFPPRSR